MGWREGWYWREGDIDGVEGEMIDTGGGERERGGAAQLTSPDRVRATEDAWAQAMDVHHFPPEEKKKTFKLTSPP